MLKFAPFLKHLGIQRANITHPAPNLINLQNVRIASPCPSDWAQMTGDDRVRHCSECNLDVYNFAVMTAAEVEQLLGSRRGGRVCARIYRRADGTMLTEDCPRGFRMLAQRVSRVAGAALAAVMSLNFAWGVQTAAQPSTQADSKAGKKDFAGTASFSVVDPQGSVIAGIEVSLKEVREEQQKSDKKKGKPRQAVREIKARTDSTGWVGFTDLRPGNYRVSVRGKGWKTYTQNITVREQQDASARIPMRVDDSELITVGIVVMTDEPLVDRTSATVIQVFPMSGDSRPEIPTLVPSRGPIVPMRQ
ncbi:MAG: carboxypeptidase-like regulatory domain-containing protein [Acidobacteriia bacterium]|nr:carboxypeptidase-like regulatory domain-containing protein [Terriglobia bacterium]